MQTRWCQGRRGDGHTACSAIKGAIDNTELGNLNLTRAVRPDGAAGLLAKIKPAVQAMAYSGERSASNYACVNTVARKKVELTLGNIRETSPVLAELADNGTIKMTGAMYNPETGAVEFFA